LGTTLAPTGLRLAVSPDGREGSLAIHQDAKLFLGSLEPGGVLDYQIERERHAWLQVVSGTMHLGDHMLNTSDGAAISEEHSIRIKALEPVHFMLFDLA
jgi:redox-sensitive bicupin YhaK (pirin superfamily)